MISYGDFILNNIQTNMDVTMHKQQINHSQTRIYGLKTQDTTSHKIKFYAYNWDTESIIRLGIFSEGFLHDIIEWKMMGKATSGTKRITEWYDSK